MSEFAKQSVCSLSRRDALQGSVAIAALCVLGCDPTEAQEAMPPSIKRALDDSEIEHGFVDFKGGHDQINGYIARPKAKGAYPVVLVVTGNSITEEYIQNTTAMLAQAGFIGFAPNIYWLQKAEMTAEEKRQVFADKITDSHI